MRHRIPVREVLLGFSIVVALAAHASAAPASSHFWIDLGERVPEAQNLPDFIDLAAKLSPAVVNISTEQKSPRHQFEGDTPEDAPGPSTQPFENFGGEHQRSLGSGFVINKSGYILTNDHVIEDARQIMVSLKDGHQYRAKVVGRDSKTDVALIKIDVPYPLPVTPLGDSDELRVGEWVMAIGNPFGFDHTVTAGIVSAKGRFIPGNYDEFIQTDASINPGNSGGPLINLHGAVVGVNSAIYTRTGSSMGIGFAIPVNLVKNELAQLRDSGRVKRGWIGVSIQDVPPEIALKDGLDENQGALITGIMDNSPAKAAGLRDGDLIVEFDHHQIGESQQLPLLVGGTPAGRTVTIKVIRGRQARQIPVTVVASREEEATGSEQGAAPEMIGALVRELSPELIRERKLGDSGGVVVSSVAPDSPAQSAGIRPGDIILEVNRHRVKNVDSYQRELKAKEPAGIILLLVNRDKRIIFIPIK